jgi:hypothetical protein
MAKEIMAIIVQQHRQQLPAAPKQVTHRHDTTGKASCLLFACTLTYHGHSKMAGILFHLSKCIWYSELLSLNQELPEKYWKNALQAFRIL